MTPTPEPTPDTRLIERLVVRNLEIRALLLRLTDPEDLGHQVGDEARAAIQAVLLPERGTA